MICTRNARMLAVALFCQAAAVANAGVIGSHEHDNTTSHSASVEVPLPPVLGQAITGTALPEAAALQPCSKGWPFDPTDQSRARNWVSSQVQAACVVSAAETELANRLTRQVWPSPDALQAAADKAASALDLRRMRSACKAPDPADVTIVFGDEVKAQIGQRIAYACGPEGVTISRDGATFFGGGLIDGRTYKVGLERGSSDKSSVGGAFLSP